MAVINYENPVWIHGMKFIDVTNVTCSTSGRLYTLYEAEQKAKYGRDVYTGKVERPEILESVELAATDNQ